jgi:hypothetical protein
VKQQSVPSFELNDQVSHRGVRFHVNLLALKTRLSDHERVALFGSRSSNVKRPFPSVTARQEALVLSSLMTNSTSALWTTSPPSFSITWPVNRMAGRSMSIGFEEHSRITRVKGVPFLRSNTDRSCVPSSTPSKEKIPERLRS